MLDSKEPGSRLPAGPADAPEALVHRLFEAISARSPEAIAVELGAERFTYGQLNARANRVARRLREAGVGPETLVGLCLERSPEMVAGLLGILKAGGAYVPLDPAYPRERLTFMLADTGLEILLTRRTLLRDLPPLTARAICVEEGEALGEADLENPASGVAPENLAYVIYTSGSTGRPKGVGIEHRGLGNVASAQARSFPIGPADRILQFSSLNFDASLFEIVMALCSGATLCLGTRESLLPGFPLLRFLREERITAVTLPPSALAALPEEDLPRLQFVFAAGEACPGGLAGRWAPGRRFFNLYGPTEATIWATAAECVRGGAKPSIGRAIPNAQVYVLDQTGRPVAAGASGEIFIGGAGVARGYRNRPAQTAEAFVPDPFSGAPGARLYRTGDLARVLPDGQLDFLGRRDDQIKLRGFRIEPKEIEGAIETHPSVREAIVMAREDTLGETRLVAYFVPGANPGSSAGEEAQGARERVGQWRSLIDSVYGTSGEGTDPTFNLAGWKDSYTGGTLPEEEMRESVENVVARILGACPPNVLLRAGDSLAASGMLEKPLVRRSSATPPRGFSALPLSRRPRRARDGHYSDRLLAERPRRVLEIGCGAGLLLLRIAPHCVEYVGTDFSQTALDSLRAELERSPGRFPPVSLLRREASDFSDIPSGGFDAVVVNSVVQFFPGAEYLLRVLEGAVRSVRPGGLVFVGDVRSLRLLEAFHASVLLHRAPKALSSAELARRIEKAVREEEELAVDPSFFARLPETLPDVRRVEVSLQRGRFHNERTRYRYDVLLEVGPRTPSREAPWLDWREDRLSPDELRRRLRGENRELLGVRGVPNARVALAMKARELLGAQALPTVADLRAALAGGEAGVDPEELWALQQETPYAAEITWSRPGAEDSFDVLFRRQGAAPGRVTGFPEAGPSLPIANDPLRGAFHRGLTRELRDFLEARLPRYLLPSAFVAMESFPLTASGKVDRGALPAPDRERPEFSRTYVPPRTPVEARIAEVWAEVLDVPRVGVDDDFFALGGHSLLATQAMARLEQLFGFAPSLADFFEEPTVARVSAGIEASRNAPRVSAARADPGTGRRETFPLSFSQERLWFLDQLSPGGSGFNVPQAVRLRGTLDQRALERALSEVVRRHGVLRTRFAEVSGEPVQVIAPPAVVPLRVLHREEETAAQRDLEEEARRPFDLARGPLFRATLVRLSDLEHILLVTMHHIVSDGWSMGVLNRELSELYRAYSRGEEPSLSDLPIQYADYAVWQREWLSGQTLEGHLAYWKERLAGAPALMALPLDRPRPAIQGYRGSRQAFGLSGPVTAALKGLARERKATLFMALLAGFEALWRQETGEEDILIGTDVANRGRVELEGLIGFFVNLLVLRGDVSGNPTFLELLSRVRESALSAYAHQELPFEKLVEVLHPERSLSYNPLVQVLLVQNAPATALSLDGLEVSPVPVESGTARFDLALFVEEGRDGGLVGSWLYNADLFERATVARLSARYEKLLAAAAADPEVSLDELDTRHGEVGLPPPPRIKGARRKAVGLDAPSIGNEAPEHGPEGQRALLARRLSQGSGEPRIFPLSFAQERFWFLDQLQPGSPFYNASRAICLDGRLDQPALRCSLDELTRRHEALRTTFLAVDGLPAQLVSDPRPFPLPLEDLGGYPEGERWSEAVHRAEEEARRPFDLQRGPLWRGVLFRLGPERHILQLTAHHIVSDGWSVGILLRELTALYQASSSGEPSPLPDLLFQYTDFAVWQRDWLREGRLEAQLSYWREQLGATQPKVDLPQDRPRPAVRTFACGQLGRLLPKALADGLRAIARREGATLFMTLLTALQVLLCRLTGEEEFVVGTAVANRNRAETEGLVGFFINTLALRVDLSGSPTFREALRRVRESAVSAYDHQDVPFEKILEQLQPERDVSRTPIFQVFFNMLNFPPHIARLSGLTVTPVELPEIGSQFDLTLYAGETEAGISLKLVYNADIFDPARMEELLAQFTGLLTGAVASPDASIALFSLVTPRAEALLPDPRLSLEEQRGETLHELFEARVRSAPERSALVALRETWSYGELEARSNRLARHLLGLGLAPGDVVAILARRDVTLPWAVLGALKAGGVFLILDPAYPEARLARCLTLARPSFFLGGKEDLAPGGPIEGALAGLPERSRIVVPAGGAHALFPEESAETLSAHATPGDLAYIAFTSGSTGAPRGILGTHAPVAHFLGWQRETFGFTPKDRFSLLSGLSHDPLLRDLFAPLALGGALCLPDPETHEDPDRLLEFLARERVTATHLTPALGRRMAQAQEGHEPLSALRYAFFGADRLTAGDVANIQKLAPSARCVNFYGATETPQAVGWFPVTPEALARASGEAGWPIPVGRGIEGVQLLVVNAAEERAGVGEPGEVRVRTPYLSRGYLDPSQNEGSFLPDSAGGRARVYRTGDLGRYGPDGNIELTGRSDEQVTIRGFRVEPAEIEAALREHPEIQTSCVVAHRSGPEEAFLAAYVVPKGGPLSREEIGEFLRARLPDYMLPSSVQALPALPLSPNGKLDRSALPPPERGKSETGFVPPRAGVEERVAAIWQEVLGIERVGAHDNFFALGGHSLLATQVVSRMRRAFEVELPLRRLFEAPTVVELARAIESASVARTPVPVVTPLSREKHRVPAGALRGEEG